MTPDDIGDDSKRPYTATNSDLSELKLSKICFCSAFLPIILSIRTFDNQNIKKCKDTSAITPFF